MKKISLRVGYVLTLCMAMAMTGALTASAQVTPADQGCITAFNKGIRRVAKEQGKLIKKCLKNYATGKLVALTPEQCLQTDSGGKLQKATDKAKQIINQKCAGGLPSFGVSAVDPALLTAVLGQINLTHGVITNDLDTGLMTTAAGANCQSQAIAALMKCSDTRLKDYLKCQKQGLRAGTITDAVSLAASCLGTGALPQPDSNGHIAFMCGSKLNAKISQHCAGTDLLQAFPSCDTSNESLLGTCLNSESACRLCETLTEVDGLTRDCDLMDDGDGVNGSCGAECGDGVLQTGEICDDGDQTAGDGCSASCSVEGGWTCTGEPSVCTQNCGDGNLDAGEICDDGDAAGGDGCSSACTVEAGWGCSGEPSVCQRDCGNGVLQGSEACDDDDEVGGDGCSSTCQVEAGYQCTGQPSVCTFVCGNGTFQAGETCDDGDASGGDGCSGTCQIEAGWMCSNQPSLCAPICGDGLTRGPEACDDDNVSNGDGCAFNCQVEAGYSCTGTPSNCAAICGDGFIRGLENCDDADTSSGDGCANICRQETGWTCTGQPSGCVLNCGDGNIDVPEQCDDGDNTPGDGCNGSCGIEAGYACGGEPSVCSPTCGNSILNVSETCDDGNIVGSDGCSPSCRTEPGWICLIPGTACTQFEIFIDTPANGVFTTGSTINITGHYTTLLPGTASVTINGAPAGFVNPVTRTFSHTLSLSAANIFNPVRATVTYTLTGDDTHDRIVVIRGDSVPDGMHSPQSVGMRINDTGLNSIEPLVGALAASQFNLAELLPAGTVMADECFIDSFLGCLGSARVTIANPPPSFSHMTLAVDSVPNSVFGDIDIFNLRIDINIDGSGLVPDCGLRLTANALQLTGNFALQPFPPPNASSVDVNLIGEMGVQFTGFNDTFTSGLCDAPIIGDIIQSLLPDIQEFAINGIKGFMNDPDGGGPADSPVADGIETVLEGISISGPVGEGVGLLLDTPLFTVAEDSTGITFGSDSRFQVSIGSGPGQCLPPVGSPDLSRSYSKPEAFPTFGATAPVSGLPYGIGIGISTAGFNQLLRGQTECGLMRTSLTTIDLDGAGGSPPQAITSTLLSLLVPEFGQLPPGTPMRIDVAPTLAPIVTGNTGPAGELTELKIAHVRIDIVEVATSKIYMRGYLDGRLGLNLAFLPDGSGLAITVATPAAADLTVAIIGNPLAANEATVETILPAIIRPLVPGLAGALSGFPLPQFFGLQLQGVEVSRQGQFLSLFANLVVAP